MNLFLAEVRKAALTSDEQIKLFELLYINSDEENFIRA